MELFFVLHDNFAVEHDDFQTKFDYQSILDQKKQKINEQWKIINENQKIYFENGERLVGRGASSLQSLGLEDGTQLIVRHGLESTWSAVLDRESSVLQEHKDHLKKEIYEDAKRMIDNLVKAHFFTTFPKLGDRRFVIEKKFLNSFDRKSEQIGKSCQIHFKKVYGEQVNITFGSREDGTRAGCVCILDDGSTISKYYVMTQHGAGDRSTNTRHNIDLKELFVYKFLQELNMGAVIDFVHGEIYSRRIVYIASKEIAGFKTLDYIQLAQPGTVEEYIECVNQMLFVYSVLMLEDHHTANMGCDNGHNPFIVDFLIIGRPMSSVNDIHEGVRMDISFNALLGTFD
ncbi:hypothetical protein GCK72_025784 [Caenorhabditis remanei]|uniref:Ubiquitin-like domain-containing protein n=1 Tax=Caenorhabditis remanei TaxID=31234 RepID=A0A6A5G309_CAERE|nr:hypothetical protein GCK72_025784 [Caenorhabditis remanei]KAF1749317.1 hypothetical protein GCK72_025784 [Caenorhabditis remanei]